MLMLSHFKMKVFVGKAHSNKTLTTKERLKKQTRSFSLQAKNTLKNKEISKSFQIKIYNINFILIFSKTIFPI